MLKLVRKSDIAPEKRNASKHHSADNSSNIAIKRAIHRRVTPAQKDTTLFGTYNRKSKDGTDVKARINNGGDQSIYLYFRNIYPSMSLNSLSK